MPLNPPSGTDNFYVFLQLFTDKYNSLVTVAVKSICYSLTKLYKLSYVLVVIKTKETTQYKLNKTLISHVYYSREPTPNVTQVVPLRWPRLRPPLVPYLRFGDDLQLLEAPYSERIQFWKRLFYDFGKKKSNYESYLC